MIWEILLGVFGAILLLVLMSLVMSGLTRFFHKLFEASFKSGNDLPATLARFAAVVTLTLCLGLLIYWRYAMGAK